MPEASREQEPTAPGTSREQEPAVPEASREQEPAVPAADEICLKPENASGITFDLYKPQGDSTFRAEAGWTIAAPAIPLLGAVRFPAAVDRESVTIRLTPDEGWEARPVQGEGLPDTMVLFQFTPAQSDPTEAIPWGRPGWLTLTVEGARTPDGQPLQTGAVSLRIYAYSREMQDSHPYLVQCYSSLGVAPPGEGL